jgi:hypothetical protein
MKDNSLKSNLFYDQVGKRWVLKDKPLEYMEFLHCMRNDSSVCPEDNDTDFLKVSSYYDEYTCMWRNQQFPVYKKSRSSIVLKFERSNASLKFYLDRCYVEEQAQKMLSDRQNTVSLEAFIKLYGKHDGEKRFQKYTEKWKRSISKYDKKDLYKNWKHTPENLQKKINPTTGELFSEEEAKQKIQDDFSKGFKKVWQEYRNGERPRSMVNTTIEYYQQKGLSLADAQLELKLRQATFSLEKCIQKYGKIKGQEVFNKRTNKWLDTLNSKSDEEKKSIALRKTRNLPRFSREATEFFSRVIDSLGDFEYEIFYGENEMILWDRVLKKPYFYDFSVPGLKLIIEYNGSAFHPNPKRLNKLEWDKWTCPFSNLNADQKNQLDQNKINLAKSIGYDVLVIWDTDSFDRKIEICSKFIKTKLKYDN